MAILIIFLVALPGWRWQSELRLPCFTADEQNSLDDVRRDAFAVTHHPTAEQEDS